MAETKYISGLFPVKGSDSDQKFIVVLVCARSEWDVVCASVPDHELNHSPFGGWFAEPSVRDTFQIVYFFSGWGKTAAAAATQYVIAHWKPVLLLNVGTCGGFEGRIGIGDVIVPQQTIIYDIDGRMGDAAEAIMAYTTKLDTSWLSGTDLMKSICPVLVSADADISPDRMDFLNAEYGTLAADWESGSIAYVAALNRIPVLIVRVVSDIVSSVSGEAYDDATLFQSRCAQVMPRVLAHIPMILERFLGAHRII